jgi:hypothetical protein
MRRKLISFIAALCLVVCLMPAETARAASDVCFVSVNDRLLELSSRAEYIYGQWYVPASCFGDFQVYNSYFPSNNTAMLFTADRQFFFDLTKGVTYDSDNVNYSSRGYLRNGAAYVPVSFVCAQFGLSWSYISGTGYGDICRIKDSAVVLSDSQFLSAASSMMKSKYQSYKNALNPNTAMPQPTMVSAGIKVYLSFQGLPSDGILKTLWNKSCQAAFFLTEDEIKTAPDTVRRIVGTGNSVGIMCVTYDEYESASALLYEAAHTATVLVSAEGSGAAACRTMAGEHGLVYCGYNADGVRDGAGLAYISSVTNTIAWSGGESWARLLCCSATENNLPMLLSYFSSVSWTVRPPDEIKHG